MREIAGRVVRELGLDYTVTLVSGGESGKYEIVMCDRPRESYFTLKLTWDRNDSLENLADVIRARLHERLSSHDRASDRRPVRRGGPKHSPV